MRVAVIGAGPGGLTTLKHLLEAQKRFTTDPVEVWLFEKMPKVGGTFRYRTYEDGELVSSRYLTAFSDFRLPDDSPDFVSTDAYLKFLEDYCSKFQLWPRMRLNSAVESVRRNEKGGHTVSFVDGSSGKKEEWNCDAVAVCSGLNVTPNIPDIKGIEHVPLALHSSKFKKREQFGEDKTVMVLGAGETGHDIGHLAITSPTKKVYFCHRNGWKNEPKKVPDPIYFGNKAARDKDIAENGVSPPTDTCFASLFDTAYLHPALNHAPFVWNYYDWFASMYAWHATGAKYGYDQYIGGHYGDYHHARRAISMKSNKLQPYLSEQYRPKDPSIMERFRAFTLTVPPISETKGRVVEVAPWPDHIDEEGYVHFKDNGRPEYQRIKDVPCKPDVMVFCTGYTSVFPFFDDSYPSVFDADVHRVWKTGVEDIGFIGYVRPSFGAMPPLAELQAQLWVANLFNRIPLPIQAKDDYRLVRDEGYRLDYIVDHDTYAYYVARDTGSAASIPQALSFGRTVFLAWALGPNFNPKFRLVGPWQWDGAAAIMEGELWTVISRRKGLAIWFLMSMFPITFFGTLSLLYFIVYGIMDLLTWPFRYTGVMKEKTERSLRSRDPMGIKRSEAVKMAHGPQKVLRD